MTFKFFKIMGIGFILSVSTLANATLIDNGDYSTDTESGLDWLDFTLTVNKTQAEALAEFSHAGWRTATGSETLGLMENFFHVNLGANQKLVASFINNYSQLYAQFHSLLYTNSPFQLFATIEGVGQSGVDTDGLRANWDYDTFPITSEIGFHSKVSGIALVKATAVSSPFR